MEESQKKVEESQMEEEEEKKMEETSNEGMFQIQNWSKFRKEKINNYVLDQMGLSSLRQQVDAQSDGETESDDDTISTDQATTEMNQVMEAWAEYTQSVRIQKAQRGAARNFIANLINLSLSITEQEDDTGTLHIYVSPNRQWGFNSRLGRAIRAGDYKNNSIDCVACLREYVYSGNGRQVLQDILSEENIKACQCAEHRCGMVGVNKWKGKTYQTNCSERRTSVFGREGSPFGERVDGLVVPGLQANGSLVDDANGERSEAGFEERKGVRGRQSFECDNREGNCEYMRGDADIIVYLCKSGAFTEAEAMAVFRKRPEGIKILCTKQYAEKIRTYIHIPRVLVFQESIKQRCERAKHKYEQANSLDNDLENIIKLKAILSNNGIKEEKFMKNTYDHFMRKGGKRNNLFFLGPPSTGNTMIMNSLFACHFNYCLLTGLISNSSFNLSGLLHTNACLMDECKLTDNQFEQWNMDVKYKDRCDVKNCVLYTCSNYPIEMYCNVPMADEAVRSRTIKFELRQKYDMYFNLSPHAWEQCWNEYNYYL